MEKLSFAPIFGDGMVLQRNKELTIWGKASGEGTVRVYLGDYRSESNVINGEWKREHKAPIERSGQFSA